jgi:hypothetical protein
VTKITYKKNIIEMFFWHSLCVVLLAGIFTAYEKNPKKGDWKCPCRMLVKIVYEISGLVKMFVMTPQKKGKPATASF